MDIDIEFFGFLIGKGGGGLIMVRGGGALGKGGGKEVLEVLSGSKNAGGGGGRSKLSRLLSFTFVRCISARFFFV
jgi:hypothetical protein